MLNSCFQLSNKISFWNQGLFSENLRLIFKQNLLLIFRWQNLQLLLNFLLQSSNWVPPKSKPMERPLCSGRRQCERPNLSSSEAWLDLRLRHCGLSVRCVGTSKSHAIFTPYFCDAWFLTNTWRAQKTGKT